MTKTDLSDIYRSYVACLNAQDWPKLGQFVAANVSHNSRQIALSGYRAMLEQDFRDIPDLHFNIEVLVSDAPDVASRLAFDCSPKATFLGLPVNGKRLAFAENVFYEFQGSRVWMDARKNRCLRRGAPHLCLSALGRLESNPRSLGAPEQRSLFPWP